jgi:hypothetical protein
VRHVARTASPSRRRRSAACLLLAATIAVECLQPMAVRAADAPPEVVFRQGADALQRREVGAAIDAFEALADQGFVHPDVSLDRGIAYAMRYRAHEGQPGDLGRAAAAFEEALLQRPDDREADAALDLVRAEVTRTRARQAKSAVVARPTLDRAIVGLAGEGAWGMLAVAVSFLFGLGLLFQARSGRLHVIGSVLAPTAAVALLLFGSLTLGARWLRLFTRPGVVIVSEAVLYDDQGRPLSGDAVPEAASVEVHERRGGMLEVRWGVTEGWVRATDVRVLARPN